MHSTNIIISSNIDWRLMSILQAELMYVTFKHFRVC